jgi:hypothetical protein
METMLEISEKTKGIGFSGSVFTLGTANFACSVCFYTRISGIRLNPLKYTDPDGRDLDELLQGAQNAFDEYAAQFIKDNEDAINSISGRAVLKRGSKEMGRFTLSGNILIEATGEGDTSLQVEGAVDFYIIGDKYSFATVQAGLRIGYVLADSSKENWGIDLSLNNFASLNLSIDGTLKITDSFGANGHLRKYLHDFNNNFSWKDLAAKNWVVGGQANFGNNRRVTGRFNISEWLGYGK